MHSRPSTTAQVTTLARAALSVPGGPLNDTYAQFFLNGWWHRLLPFLRTRIRGWPWFRELLVNVGGRTCFFDEQLINSLKNGIGQVVILGAGYDSRALRLATPGVQFFELDHPATQSAKIAILNKRGISSEATFIPIDFQSDDLVVLLKDADFSGDCKTFFLLEGVVEYLNENAVHRTLQALHSIAASGSILAFDPLHPAQTERPHFLRWIGIMAARLLGEQRHFMIDPNDLGSLLDSEGWRLERVLDAEALYRQYLQDFLQRHTFQHNYVAIATPT